MQLVGKPRVLVLPIILGSLAVGLAQDARPEVAAIPAPPPITLPLTAITPEATVEAGGDRLFAVAPDGVWVSNRSAGTVARIDPKTNVPDKPVSIGKEPCHSMVSAFKSLWASLCGPGMLARMGLTEENPITTIGTAIRGAGPLVAATGSIWMITDAKGTLVRIDPDTNAVVAEVTIASGATSIASAADALWITSAARSVVTRVDGYSNIVEDTIKTGRSPIAVASGEGSVWTLNGGDGSVSRIDPKTNKVVETIKAGAKGATGTIVVGEGSVWVSTPGLPLSRIDPRTNRLAQQFTGPGGGVLEIGFKSLWLNATPTHVWRIDPKRVEATRK